MFRWRDESDGLNRHHRDTTLPASGAGGGAALNLWVEPVLDDQDSSKAPPGSPTSGDRYIVPGSATGAWSGHGGEIAEWNGSSWAFTYDFDEGSESFVTHREKIIHLVEFNEPGDFTNQKVFATNSFVKTWLSDVIVHKLTNVFAGAITDTRNAPPGSPLHGDAYIVGSSPSGVWNSVGSGVNTIAIAVRDLTSNTYKWVHRTPDTGTIVHDLSTGGMKRWDGSAWVAFPVLSVLGNVDVTEGPAIDGYVLTWNDANGNWEAAVGPAPAGHTLVSHTDVDITPGPAVDGYVVTYNDGTGMFELATAGAPGAHTLDSHSNVDSTGKTTGTILQWDGSDWSTGITVVVSAPSTGQALVWDGSKWANGAPTIASHNHILDSLSNVNTSGKVVGDSIKWDGTNWVKYTINLDSLSDVVITSPSSGQGLIYNGSNWVNGTPTASVPTGTGRTAALWTGAIGSGAWTYTVVGSTGFDGSWPYFLVPSGYTKARVTTTYSNNTSPLSGAARGNSLTNGSQIGVGVIHATGGLTSGASTNVSAYYFATGQTSNTKEQRLSYESPIFSVSTNHRLYPFNDSSSTVPYVDTNPLFMQIELFT